MYRVRQTLGETFYPETGKPKTYSPYANGQLTGTSKAWDPDGRIVKEIDYQNGTKIPDSPELIACIEHVINDVKEAADYPIGREEVGATCREEQRANTGMIAQPVAQQAAPEIAALVAPAPSSTASPSGPASAANRVSADTGDGPAAKRCGWIENDMPSSLTLKERDGTWSVVSGDGQAEGFA